MIFRAKPVILPFMQSIVKGQSMLPSIRALDVCIFREIEPDRIRTGDVLVYDEDGISVVHRVLDIDRGKGCVLIKGDNTPFRHANKIPFTVIRGKVCSVKRGSKVIDLEKLPRKLTGALLAALSRYDFTPLLFKKRFIDPLLIGITKNPLYVFLRRAFYGNISFMCSKKGDLCKLYAFVGKTKSAEATLELKKDGYVLVDSYIRHRDRNPVFEKKFNQKIHEYLSFPRLSAVALAEAEKRGSNKNIDLYPALDFSFSRLSNEEKLVILCSRVEMPGNMKERSASLLSEGAIDWDRFIEAAGLHMVKPLVYRHMQLFSEYMPEKVKRELRDEGARILARDVRALEEIKYLAKLFAESSLEVLFIKGASFILDIYRDKPGLRPLSDIDVLVREEDFGDVDNILRKKGFRPCEGNKGLERYRTQVLYSFEGKIFLDVHRGFIGRKLHDDMLNVGEERVWKNKRKIPLQGTDVYTLDLTHTLLYQCLHLAMHHSFSGIRWYVDMLEFLNKYGDEMDWGQIARLARDYGIQRPVYYSLFFARGMLSAPVPENILNNMGKIERKLDRLIFNKIKKNNAEMDYLAELFMFDSLYDTAKFIGLSFVHYPYLILHFFRIFTKVIINK